MWQVWLKPRFKPEIHKFFTNLEATPKF